MFLIGELSKRTSVSVEAIRYYESIELLPHPQRASNGYRMYGETDVERLQFIQRARTLDFSLDEITEILDFREQQTPPCSYVMDVMHERITEIEVRIRDLQRLQIELQVLYQAGKELPEDVQMRECVCHLIRTGF